MRAEKRLLAPEGGLESLSAKEDSEQDKRFLKMQYNHHLKTFFTSIQHNEIGLTDTLLFFLAALTAQVIQSSNSCP